MQVAENAWLIVHAAHLSVCDQSRGSQNFANFKETQDTEVSMSSKYFAKICRQPNVLRPAGVQVSSTYRIYFATLLEKWASCMKEPLLFSSSSTEVWKKFCQESFQLSCICNSSSYVIFNIIILLLNPPGKTWQPLYKEGMG